MMKQVSLEDVSNIRHRFYLTEDNEEDQGQILIVSFSGRYPDGSLGNIDAAYMYQIVELARAVWYHSGLMIDMSELEYEFGDAILSIAQGWPDRPFALVVGPKCAGALATLIHDEMPAPPVTDLDWVFDTFDDALSHIRGKFFNPNAFPSP